MRLILFMALMLLGLVAGGSVTPAQAQGCQQLGSPSCTPATTPLSGSEQFYCLQGGVTKSCLVSSVQTGGGGGVISSVFGRVGVVTAQTGDYTISQITNGAALNISQSFTAGQAVSPGAGGTQTPGGTFTMNFAVANSFSATFGAGNLTIANPTNVKSAQEGCLALTQDSVGGRTASWGANFKWPSGTPPTLSTAANATDLVCWHAVSPTFVGGQLTMAALQ